MEEEDRSGTQSVPVVGSAATLHVGDRVWWKKAPEYRGRVTQVKGAKRKHYMVRWDAYEHDSGEYGISEFLIEARLRRA